MVVALGAVEIKCKQILDLTAGLWPAFCWNGTRGGVVAQTIDIARPCVIVGTTPPSMEYKYTRITITNAQFVIYFTQRTETHKQCHQWKASWITKGIE